MKVYDMRRYEDLDHPEDMKKILEYLCNHGELHVTSRTVERLYSEFSDEHYANWLAVSDGTIGVFAEWLDNYTL